MPRFSVIIPTYNRLELLKEALASVWAQTFTDYELIVVDDGSTDHTWEYLQTLEGRVKAFRQQNAGPGAARNLGINAASGEYVAFLDSDDLWLPWTLETFNQVANSNKQPAVVSGAYIDFLKPDEITGLTNAELIIALYDDYLSSAEDPLWLGVPATMVRTDVIRRVKFSHKNANGEDNDLWLRLGEQKSFVYIHNPPLFAYRRHTASRIAALHLSYIGAKHMAQSERSGEYPGGARRLFQRLVIIGRHVRPVIVGCARNGLRREAWELYRDYFVWNLKAKRWKFLLGLPVLIALFRLKNIWVSK